MTGLALHEERLGTPIGEAILLTGADGAVRALDWHDHEDRMHRLLRRQIGPYRLSPHKGESAPLAALRRYFAGAVEALDDLAVSTGGTDFQRAVWRLLRAIPVGSTISYAELATRFGRPTAVRAVAQANGANPVGLIVPCHRVIGSNGALTGYGGGIERKRWLLAHEGARLRP